MPRTVEWFLERISPARARTEWWKDLDREQRQGQATGRFLEETLADELRPDLPNYRADRQARRLNFFEENGRHIDGCFENVGVEEKVFDLRFDKIIDGAIHRGLIWVLGNPQQVADGPIEAVGICVVPREKAARLTQELVDALGPIMVAIRRIGIHLVFVQKDTGVQHRIRDPESPDAFPPWLAEVATPATWELVPRLKEPGSAVDSKLGVLRKGMPIFGGALAYDELAIGQHLALASARWDEEWQMLEIGLLLRSRGYPAVRVKYENQRRKTLRPGSCGVERRVREEMAERFGVVLEWGVDGL